MRAGYSMRELAERADVSAFTISHLESRSDKEKTTALGIIDRLAAALGCEPAWLAYGVMGLKTKPDTEED